MKKLLVFLVFGGVLSIGAAYWFSPAAAGGGEVPFTIKQVERGDLVETVSATGQVAPPEVTLVSSQIPGQVVTIYRNADYNRPVEENEPLLVLDQSLARIKVEQAKVAVELAKADVERAEAARDAAEVALKLQSDLVKKQLVPEAKKDEASYLFNAAKAAVEAARGMVDKAKKAQAEAQLGLDKTFVLAPSSGIIVDRKVSLGQMVGPQLPTPLFTIAADLSQMQVNAQVAEGDISKIRVGLEAEFTVYAYADSDVRFQGQVKQIRIMPINVQAAVFYSTIIEVPNRRVPPSRDNWKYVGGVLTSALVGPSMLPWLLPKPEETWMLRPGMTANVDFIRRRHHDVWKMPIEAINFQLEDPYWTTAARTKVDEWKKRPDYDQWKYVWIKNAQGKAWPIFVRVDGTSRAGEQGIRDAQFIEVLEWEPEIAGKLNRADVATFPRVITAAPPAHKEGLFDRKTRVGL